ncbi:hypothetical protein FRC07_009725 [Ceratobasidium sp. 392]|nr:hypothetical protein FRC07_009725 [Ceratobasidium sp. 392]
MAPQSVSTKKIDTVVKLADSKDKLLIEFEQPQNDLLFPQEEFVKRRWICAELNLQFSVYVGYNGVEPPYPGTGWLNITVYLDGIQTSDAFIDPAGITSRAAQKQSRRAVGQKKKHIGNNKVLTDK